MKYIWLALLPAAVVWQYKTRGSFVLGGEWLLLVLFFLNDDLWDMLRDLAKWVKKLCLLVSKRRWSHEEIN